MMRCAGNPGVSLDYNGARRLRRRTVPSTILALGVAWIVFGFLGFQRKAARNTELGGCHDRYSQGTMPAEPCLPDAAGVSGWCHLSRRIQRPDSG